MNSGNRQNVPIQKIHSPSCMHRLPATGEAIPCGPGRKCMARVYGCEKHGRCVLSAMSDLLTMTCAICPDRAPFTTSTKEKDRA